jgi:hypothetical protein
MASCVELQAAALLLEGHEGGRHRACRGAAAPRAADHQRPDRHAGGSARNSVIPPSGGTCRLELSRGGTIDCVRRKCSHGILLNAQGPKSLTLVFLPSRATELNPVQNVWQYLRADWLSTRSFNTYGHIIETACQASNNLIGQPGVVVLVLRRRAAVDAAPQCDRSTGNDGWAMMVFVAPPRMNWRRRECP